MRILVTGAAGFIGSNLVNYLIAEGGAEFGVEIERVVGLDCLSYAGSKLNLQLVAEDERFSLVEGSIADRGLLEDVLVREEIDCVMHLAAESHVDRSIDGPRAFVETNCVGTFELLEAVRVCVQGGRSVRLLHVSTDEVYGSLEQKAPAFSETTAYAPNSPYSASKAASDHFVRAWHHTFGLDVVTTNCSNNYGPYQFPEKLIPLMITKALAGERLPVYGDGSNRRDWLYVGDHVRALLCAAVKGKAGETYNVGGGEELDNLSVVKRILAILRDRGFAEAEDSLIEFVTDRPGHDWRYAIDCGKIERELEWRARYDFEAGMERTVDWYLSHGEWLEAVVQERYDGQRLGRG